MLLLVRRAREWPQIRATGCYSGLGSELVTRFISRSSKYIYSISLPIIHELCVQCKEVPIVLKVA